MKKILEVPHLPKVSTAIAVIITAIWIAGCSESSNVGTSGSTGSATKSTVKTTTGINNRVVTPSSVSGKSANIGDFHPTVDSIFVTRARVVISSLILHQVGESDLDTIIIIAKDKDIDGDKGHGNGKKHHEDDDWKADDTDVFTFIDREDGTIRVGPFLAEFSDTGRVISEVTIPPGTYDKMKFEIHKLDEEDDPALLNDPIFGDFVNGGRFTFIVDGFAYVNGIAYPFSYRSSITDNITIQIQPPVSFTINQIYTLQLGFDPRVVFGVPGSRPLDPREVNNQHQIDEGIKNSIVLLAIKK